MNLILVHGAWHDASCWDPVIPSLSQFTQIHALKMPGRVFELSRAYQKISLLDYVRALEDCIDSLEGPIVLVGHSLAGLTISQAAENRPERIQQLIYVAAFIPKSGESLFDMTSKIETPGVSTELDVCPPENRMSIRPSKRTRDLFYNLCAPDDAESALSSLIPEPLKAFTTPVQVTSNRFGQISKAYIRCLEDKAILPADQQCMIEKTNIQTVLDLDADHSPFLSRPEAFVDAMKHILL